MSDPTPVGPDEAIAQIAAVIEKLGARSLEIGFFVDGDDPDRDPEPGEDVTWWAKAQHRGGPVWTAERRGHGPWVVVQVVGELAEKMGARVRIRWEEAGHVVEG